ncbi:cytohesin-1 [Sarcoptes scabiei]|nr:cytohesin-1 [Sarcoptes scabiei]
MLIKNLIDNAGDFEDKQIFFFSEEKEVSSSTKFIIPSNSNWEQKISFDEISILFSLYFVSILKTKKNVTRIRNSGKKIRFFVLILFFSPIYNEYEISLTKSLIHYNL